MFPRTDFMKIKLLVLLAGERGQSQFHEECRGRGYLNKLDGRDLDLDSVRTYN